VTHDYEICADLPGELSDFFRRLAADQLSYRIESQTPQAGDAFIEYLLEVFFHPNGCSSQRYFGQQQRTGVGEDR
jgi:hypothetical protein